MLAASRGPYIAWLDQRSRVLRVVGHDSFFYLQLWLLTPNGKGKLWPIQLMFSRP